MSAITFDTLVFANKLKTAGVPSAQAEAQARALADAIGEIDVATRADFVGLSRDIEVFRKEVRDNLESLEQRLTIKLGAFLVIAVTVVLTFVGLFR